MEFDFNKRASKPLNINLERKEYFTPITKKKARDKPNKPKKANPERIIQDAVCKYMLLKKYLVVHVNSSVLVSEYTGQPVRSYTIRNNGASSGFPDVLAISSKRTLLLEIKSANGRQTESQKKFEQLAKSLGLEYYVIKSINELEILFA